MTIADRRTERLARYAQLFADRPNLFVNPPGAAFEIMFDRASQDGVADMAARRLRERGLPEEYGDIGVVYEDEYFIVVRDAVRYRSGDDGAYVRILGAHPGASPVVLPILADGRLLLVRHFRHGSRQWHWEVPRGFGEPGADGASGARKELAQEIGAAVDDVQRLGRIQEDGDIVEIYLAKIDLESAASSVSTPDAIIEGIDEKRAFTLREFADLIEKGEMTDVYTLAAFALAMTKGLLTQGQPTNIPPG